MSKFGLCFALSLLPACGGSGTPAEGPKAAEGGAAADSAKDAPSDSASAGAGDFDAKPTAKSSAPKPSAKGDDSPKLTRSARDILTAPDVVFMFSFNDSDVKQTAESKCTASSGNDPKKMSQCMSKAHKVVDVDGYRFKEKDNKWYWLTLRTQGKILHTVHKFEVDFAPDQEGSVTLKPKGKDLGSGHGRTPASVTFEVPNEYQIALNDTKLGKLVYEAKIGIASD